MLLTDDLLIPCMPKTGSSWRRDVLAPLIGARTDFQCRGVSHGGHTPMRDVHPDAYATREVVLIVREPLAWYRSWYLHAVTHSLEGGEFRPGGWVKTCLEHWGNGSTEWEAVLYGLTHPWERHSFPPREDHLWNPGGMGRAGWHQQRRGMWSHSTWWFLLGERATTIAKFVKCQNQREWFALRYPEHADAILTSEARNVGAEWGPEGGWWTPEREAWVESADDTFGLWDGPDDGFAPL